MWSQDLVWTVIGLGLLFVTMYSFSHVGGTILAVPLPGRERKVDLNTTRNIVNIIHLLP